jgi:hypothetical protein
MNQNVKPGIILNHFHHINLDIVDGKEGLFRHKLIINVS